MKIRKELIGSTVYCKKIDANLVIKEGNEAQYKTLGLDVFEAQKIKENAVRKKGSRTNKSVHVKGVNDSSDIGVSV